MLFAETFSAQALFADDNQFMIQGGLSTRAHVFIGIATAVALVFIYRLVRRRQLAGKYAVLWTVAALALGLLAVFPGLLTWTSEVLRVSYPPALFLLITTGFLFIVVIHFSWELSRLEDRTRTLAEEVALLRAERPNADGVVDTAGPDDVGPVAVPPSDD